MRRTSKDLQRRVDELNEALGRPMAPWIRRSDSDLRGSVGCFHIYKTHFGYELHEMMSESGAVRQHGETIKTSAGFYSYLGGLCHGVELAHKSV
jgi:hypothetical protein